MSAIYHLSCGEMTALPNDTNSKTVCHCLLLEGSRGYALVDTGFGFHELQNAQASYRDDLIKTWGIVVNPQLSALRQLGARKIDPRDVRDIVLTHLDFDHAGGLRDFPEATVHLSAEEFKNLESSRYLQRQWKHAPKWRTHGAGREHWLEMAVRPVALDAGLEVLLVPLFGHTRGHCGVAIATDHNRWLLHAGDSYLRRGELSTQSHFSATIATQVAEDNVERLRTLDKLRRLRRDHSDEIEFFCAHDEAEFTSLQKPRAKAANCAFN